MQAGSTGEEREVTHRGRSSVDSNTAEMARENNTNMIRVGQVSYVRAFVETKYCSHNKNCARRHTHTCENTSCLFAALAKRCTGCPQHCWQIGIFTGIHVHSIQYHALCVCVCVYMQCCFAASMSIFKMIDKSKHPHCCQNKQELARGLDS